MITKNLSTLKINKLSQKQYDRESVAGNLNENEIYLTPDTSLTVWQPNTEYKVDDVVIGDISFDGFYYFQAILFCKRNHTSESELHEDKRLNLYEDVRSGMWGVKPFISREAECDKEGNFIHETYATKDELAEAIGEALEGDY